MIVQMWNKEVESAAREYFARHVFNPLGISSGAWVAGGAVRTWIETRRVPSSVDFDVWFADPSELQRCEIAAKAEEWDLVAENATSSNWISKKGKLIQFIRKHFFADVSTTLMNFDFTICALGVTREGVFHHRDAVNDIAMKRLSVIQLDYPLSTFRRAMKYSARGFKMCGGNALKLIAAIQAAESVAEAQAAAQAEDGGGGVYPWGGLD